MALVFNHFIRSRAAYEGPAPPARNIYSPLYLHFSTAV